jgi:hypothetical protein
VGSDKTGDRCLQTGVELPNRVDVTSRGCRRSKKKPGTKATETKRATRYYNKNTNECGCKERLGVRDVRIV